MRVQIFDVEHGSCALVTADTGARILIDCGHNTTTGWRSSNYLNNIGISHLEKLIITNYDEDHASDLENILNVVSVGTLTTNPSVTGNNLKHLKGIREIRGGINTLADMKNRYTAPVSGPGPDFGDLSFSYFWNRYPTDFEDENNLSLVVIMKAYGLTMCFPGDMEVPGWQNLLGNMAFREAIGGVNILNASHHGRENGCCDELFSQTALFPVITIISDSGVQYATQETVAWYRARARGFQLNGENRHVLTTRRDGRILVEATPARTTVSVAV